MSEDRWLCYHAVLQGRKDLHRALWPPDVPGLGKMAFQNMLFWFVDHTWGGRAEAESLQRKDLMGREGGKGDITATFQEYSVFVGHVSFIHEGSLKSSDLAKAT